MSSYEFITIRHANQRAVLFISTYFVMAFGFIAYVSTAVVTSLAIFPMIFALPANAAWYYFVLVIWSAIVEMVIALAQAIMYSFCMLWNLTLLYEV